MWPPQFQLTPPKVKSKGGWGGGADFVSYVPYNDIIFSKSAYEEFISTHVKICTQWTTKTLNMSLKYSICFLAITYGKTYYVSILYLHFPYNTHFCKTHSGWLQLPLAASSCTPKYMITEIRLTRPRVRRGRWNVVILRCAEDECLITISI